MMTACHWFLNSNTADNNICINGLEIPHQNLLLFILVDLKIWNIKVKYYKHVGTVTVFLKIEIQNVIKVSCYLVQITECCL